MDLLLENNVNSDFEWYVVNEENVETIICDDPSDAAKNGETGAETSRPLFNIRPPKIPHVCNECGKSFKTECRLTSHMRVHTGEKPHVCSVCQKAFALKVSLDNHMTIHTGETPFMCTLCNMKFRTQALGKRHLSLHVKEQPNLAVFMCTVCETILTTAERLEKHMLTHTQHACTMCEKVFTEKGKFETHMLRHKGERRYKCSVCEKAYFKKSSLDTHLIAHSDVTPYACDQCPRSFKTSAALKKHIKSIHTVKPNACSICKASYDHKESLDNHMRKHSGEKPFKCSQCKRAFAQQNFLLAHMRAHVLSKEKRFMCSKCPKAFSLKNYLDNHMISHSAPRPYACRICPKRFLTVYNLNFHMAKSHSFLKRIEPNQRLPDARYEVISHSGVKRFKCTLCPWTCSCQSSIYRHIDKKHPSAKPFVCSLCPKSYTQKVFLDSHMLVHALKNRFVCSLCPMSYAEKYYLDDHMRTHRGKQRFSCSLCPKTYLKRQTLNHHLKSHPESHSVYNQDTLELDNLLKESEQKPFQCSLCLMSFALQQEYSNHMATHPVGGKLPQSSIPTFGEHRTFLCSLCPESFAYKRDLSHHMKSHSVGKHFADAYAQDDPIDYNDRVTLGEDRPFLCSLCPVSFANKRDLNDHMKSHSVGKHLAEAYVQDDPIDYNDTVTHAVHRPFLCSVCMGSFTQKQDLIRHMKSHGDDYDNDDMSMDVEPFSHDDDPLGFDMPIHTRNYPSPNKTSTTRKRKISASKKLPTNEKRFKCHVCEKAFPSEAKLVGHLRSHTGEKPFKCSLCPKAFTHNGNLTAHLLIHTGEKRYVCSMCQVGFNQKNCLEKHMKKQHPYFQPYVCETCNKSFLMKDPFERHKLKHAGIKPFSCPLCQKSFTYKALFDIHLRKHAVMTPPSYKCKECNNMYTTQIRLNRHVKTHRKEPPYMVTYENVENGEGNVTHKKGGKAYMSKYRVRYRCGLCEKSFTQKSSLQCHVRVHTGEKPFSCETCDRTFTYRSHYKSHVQAHTGLKPHKCNICSKSFASKKSRDLHLLRTHADVEKTFQCEECQLMFTFFGLKRHMVLHTNKYKCDKCNRRFGSKFHLDKHELIHVNRVGTLEKCHKCHLCEKSFFHKSSLNHHSRIHTDIKPFKCNVCDAAFYFKNTLNSHSKTHTRIKCHKCKICEETFTDRKELMRHQLASHKRYKCKECPSSYYNNSGLRLHMRKHFESLKAPYECSFCDLKFAVTQSLDNHMFLKHLICRVCDKIFDEAKDLYSHNMAEHSKNDKCTLCNVTFTEDDVHGYSRVLLGGSVYLCKSCDIKCEIEEPIGENDEENEYECRLCSESFGYNGILSHMETHRKR